MDYINNLWNTTKNLVESSAWFEFCEEKGDINPVSLKLEDSKHFLAYSKILENKAEIVISKGLIDCVFRVLTISWGSDPSSALFLRYKWVYENKNKLKEFFSRLRWFVKIGGWQPISTESKEFLRQLLAPDHSNDFYEFAGINDAKQLQKCLNMSKKQFGLAYITTQWVISFIGYHELAHIALGHAQLNHFKNDGNSLFGSKLRQFSINYNQLHNIFELHADQWAFEKLASHLVNRSLGLEQIGVRLSRIQKMSCLITAVQITFMIMHSIKSNLLDKCNFIWSMVDNESKMNPNIRLTHLIDGLKHVFNNLGILKWFYWPTFSIDFRKLSRLAFIEPILAWEYAELRSELFEPIENEWKDFWEEFQSSNILGKINNNSNEIDYVVLNQLLFEAHLQWMLGESKYNEISKGFKKYRESGELKNEWMINEIEKKLYGKS